MASLGLRMPSNTTRRTLKTHSHSHIKSHISFVESLSHIYMMAEFFLLCLSTGSQSIDHCHSVQSVENTGGSSASAYQLLIQLLLSKFNSLSMWGSFSWKNLPLGLKMVFQLSPLQAGKQKSVPATVLLHPSHIL